MVNCLRVGQFVTVHADKIEAALRLAEQPPTDAAGMRERAANVEDQSKTDAENIPGGEQTKFLSGWAEASHQIATNIRALPLPPSPTTDALKLAEEALAEAAPILKSFAAVEAQFSREGTPTAAFYRCIDALAAIRKTKEG